MINIDEIKPQIVKALKPLDPEKIILFGSYAYGTPTEESDIDLFLIKDTDIEAESLMRLRDLIKKERVGFDIICDSRESVEKKEDYFYKVDILQNGEVLYAK